jgi:Xaa-Pro aminopeptidase
LTKIIAGWTILFFQFGSLSKNRPAMSADRSAARRQNLLQQLRSQPIEALLVSNETNVGYLTGFTGDSSFLLIGQGICTLVSDGRYTTQIADECPELDVYIRPQTETIIFAAAKVVKKAKLQKLGIEADHLSLAFFEKLKSEVKGLQTLALTDVVENLRQIKDAYEIAEIRQAIRQAEKGFDVLRAQLRGELTERDAAHTLEQAMRQFGATVASFPPIVAVGARSALPHARPTMGLISGADFVLIDWGASAASGYKSDLTRVLVTGKISTKLEKVYGVVLKAQQSAIRSIRAGARCCDIDAIARRVIEHAGFGKQFSHGLGHGIGLNVHESPRLSAASDAQLRSGMVVTVEPGIYLEGWGGVRIEDDCLVTRHGCEVLTSVPKEFEQVVVR